MVHNSPTSYYTEVAKSNIKLPISPLKCTMFHNIKNTKEAIFLFCFIPLSTHSQKLNIITNFIEVGSVNFKTLTMAPRLFFWDCTRIFLLEWKYGSRQLWCRYGGKGKKEEMRHKGLQYLRDFKSIWFALAQLRCPAKKSYQKGG